MTNPVEVIIEALPQPGLDCTLVGIDGVDGSGKTIFALALAERLQTLDRPCLVIHADHFLRLRADRHRRGRDSPLGYFLDSYDYPALITYALDPLGPGGDRRYRSRVTDLAQDRRVDEPLLQAPPGAVAIVEGLFLHRDELADRWDFSIFLDAPFEITMARMARRDGTHPDPTHPSVRRYVEGQRHYFRECRPWSRADLVIDNADPTRPKITTGQDISSTSR